MTLTLTVPADASGQADTVLITATSTISPAIWARARDVTLVDLGVQLQPDQSQSVTPGTVLTYTHTLTNAGGIAVV